jgi:hypothetical protein
MFYCLSNVNKKLNGQRGKHHFKIVVYVKASIEREEKKSRDNNVSHLNFFFIQAEIMRLLSPNTLGCYAGHTCISEIAHALDNLRSWHLIFY